MTREGSCHSEERSDEESLGRCFWDGGKILRCAQNDNGGAARNDNGGAAGNDRERGRREKLKSLRILKNVVETADRW